MRDDLLGAALLQSKQQQQQQQQQQQEQQEQEQAGAIHSPYVHAGARTANVL
jgi:hypothetical protein